MSDERSNSGERPASRAPARRGPGPAAAGDDGALVAIVMVVILVLAMLAGLFLLGAYMSRRTARRMMAQVQAQAAAQQGLVASPQVAALVDQGVALMSQFEPAKAEALFAQAALLEPGFVTNLNQAIALLNRSEPDSQERAIVMLQAIVSTNQANPEIARAFYCLGLAHSYLGRPDQALQHFQRASSLRPDDAAAHYQVALALEQLDRLDEALAEYEMAHEHDPLLRSALLGIQRTQARLGNEQAAAQALERFVALENNPRARLTEFKYTRMGPLSEAIPAVGARNSPTGPNFGPPLTSTQGQATSNPLVGEPLLAPASDSAPRFGAGTPVPIDFDGDGLTDLFVPGGAGADGRSLLLRQNDTGSYARVENDLASMPSVRFVAFADYDNDGRTDALVVTREPAASRLMRRAEDGSFAETMRWEESRDALWADLDHDGDLDLVLARIGTTPLVLMNRGAEGFEALDRRSGLIDTPADCTGLAVGDLDGDSQLDLAFLTASDSQIWINDGFWHWRRSAELAALERNSSERMVIAEDPITGDPLVVSMTPSAAPGAPVPPAPPAPGTAPARFLKPWVRRGVPSGRAWYSFATIAVDADSHFELVDLLGNGTRQLLVGEPQRTRLVGLDGSTMLDLPVPAGSRCAVVANGTDPQPVIAAWSAAGPMILRRPVGGPWQPVVAVDFRGRIDPSTNMRSNADGIGTRWSSRVDDRWNGGWVLRTTSGPGQGRQPVFIGLGSSAKSLGALFIDWPDGVIQSEMSLAPGTRHTITETQRQISSCPVIFAWDGERFAFETDCLGVGGLGYLVGADRDEAGRVRPLRAPPRPRESVPLRGPIRERDGAFELRLTEPMEEACYLDAARLIEWRVPAGWECVLDERMAINGPEPTGEMRFYRESMEPASASLSNRFGALAPKEQSSNATARELMTARDHRAVEFGSPDPRFIGRLREQGTLTLTFPRELDSRGGRPALVVDGWVEYPYSQTSFAMWQENASPKAPSIDALDPATNAWITLAEEIGYPAGMQRECLLPLSGAGIAPIPPGCTTIRIRTSVELYLDRMRLAWLEPCPEAASIEHPLIGAEIARCGFARRIDRPQKRPDYDYGTSAAEWDCRVQPGLYTNFGECTPLAAAPDGALAIFGPGEEIRLRFGASGGEHGRASDGAARQREGGRSEERRASVFVLEVEGWCKDMDRYTGDGATLAPIPAREGLSDDERRRAESLQRTFNRRLHGGR